jgi:hypothetical protein
MWLICLKKKGVLNALFFDERVIDSFGVIALNGTDMCDRDAAAGTSASSQIATVYLNL